MAYSIYRNKETLLFAVYSKEVKVSKMDTKDKFMPQRVLKKSSPNSKLKDFGPIFFSYIEQPTFIVALTSAIIYFFAFLYYSSFCNRLSIPINNFPQIFYVKGFLLLSVVILYLLFIYMYIKIINKHSAIGKTFFLLLMLFLIYSFQTNFKDIYWVLLDYSIIISLFITIYLIESKNDKLFSKIWKYFSIGGIIISSLVVLYFLPQMGELDAENLIEGANGSLEIKLDMKDVTTTLENKTLILIIPQSAVNAQN